VTSRVAVVCLFLIGAVNAVQQANCQNVTTEQRPARATRAASGPKAPPGTAGVTFADGTTQTTAAFGTITGVSAGSGLSGGGASGNVPLAVDTTVARTAGGNSLVGTQAITGNLVVTGNIQINGNGNGVTFADASTQTTATAGGGGSTLSGTIAINLGTSIGSGTCMTSGVTVTGATTNMVAVISPQGDPSTKGLLEVLWGAFVDGPDHVTAQFCHFSHCLASATSTQTFNIRVIK